MKKKSRTVKFSIQTEGRSLFLRIDCPSYFLAGKWLAFCENWLENIAERHEKNAQIVTHKEKKNG